MDMAKEAQCIPYMQAFSEDIYEKWLGYASASNVIRVVPGVEASGVVGVPGNGDSSSEYQFLVSPNVLREVRDHFGCPTLVGALLGERAGIKFPDQFSMRHYPVRCSILISTQKMREYLVNWPPKKGNCTEFVLFAIQRGA